MAIHHKQHPIHQSRLFKILGKTQFEDALGVDWDSVGSLVEKNEYRVWTTDKGREIQAPYGWTLSVHKRIAKLLSRIETPDFLYSKKGRSYVSNAAHHKGRHPLIKTDISSFYPSVTRRMVFQSFQRDFQCASDVADKIADICCYNGVHLPTGSPLSGYVSFFAAAPLFTKILALAERANCKMSLYVDDITISGPGATKRLLSEVRKEIAAHGFSSKKSKSKTFSAHAAKPVTGAVIVDDEIRLPNSRYKLIRDVRAMLNEAREEERPSILRQLRGREIEAQQVLGAASSKSEQS